MDLVNKQVSHKSFGKGSVVKHTDDYIEVHFTSGNKKFVFPDAIGKYVALTDQRVADSVKKIIQKSEEERKLKELAIEEEKALQYKEAQRILHHEKLIKNLKIHPSSQAAFRCEEEDQDRIFAEWKAYTGVIKSGCNKGQPNRPVRLRQNSACLLTERDTGMNEQDRCILGVYMVHENFIGSLCDDGYVSAHSQYKLRLSKEESAKILFWNYYANEKYPHNMTWNSGNYRYFDNVCVAQILKDIVSLKTDKQERESVQRFFEHFCKINRIDRFALPKPNGTLMRI